MTALDVLRAAGGMTPVCNDLGSIGSGLVPWAPVGDAFDGNLGQ